MTEQATTRDAHGQAVADETDTAIRAMDALRAGEDMPGRDLWAALGTVRRLRGRLEALEAELVLYAREAGAQGRPRMPLREIGEALDLHFTTVNERHGQLISGKVPEYRNWLIEGTARPRLGAVTMAGRPVHGDCEVCGHPILEGVAKSVPHGWAHGECYPQWTAQ